MNDLITVTVECPVFTKPDEIYPTTVFVREVLLLAVPFVGSVVVVDEGKDSQMEFDIERVWIGTKTITARARPFHTGDAEDDLYAAGFKLSGDFYDGKEASNDTN